MRYLEPLTRVVKQFKTPATTVVGSLWSPRCERVHKLVMAAP